MLVARAGAVVDALGHEGVVGGGGARGAPCRERTPFE